MMRGIFIWGKLFIPIEKPKGGEKRDSRSIRNCLLGYVLEELMLILISG